MYIRRVKYPTSQEILYLLFFKVYREHLKNLQHKFLVFLKVAEPFRNLQNVYFQSEISHEREFLGLMALVLGYPHFGWIYPLPPLLGETSYIVEGSPTTNLCWLLFILIFSMFHQI
jgi:hypothetical protein